MCYVSNTWLCTSVWCIHMIFLWVVNFSKIVIQMHWDVREVALSKCSATVLSESEILEVVYANCELYEEVIDWLIDCVSDFGDDSVTCDVARRCQLHVGNSYSWMNVCVVAQMRNCRQHCKSWQTCKSSWQSFRQTMRDWQKRRVCYWSHYADRLRNWRTAVPKLTHCRSYCFIMTRLAAALSVSRSLLNCSRYWPRFS